MRCDVRYGKIKIGLIFHFTTSMLMNTPVKSRRLYAEDPRAVFDHAVLFGLYTFHDQKKKRDTWIDNKKI